MATDLCPLCRLSTAEVNKHLAHIAAPLWLAVHCETCGTFQIASEVSNLLISNRKLVPFLSAHTRQTSEQGGLARVDLDNWQTLADGHRRTSVVRKLEMLLSYLAARTVHPGAMVYIEANDYPLIDVAHRDEADYLLNALESQGALKPVAGYHVVTPEGWLRLSSVSPGGTPGTCFIAMAFDPSLDEAFTVGIERAVHSCGLRPIRTDRVQQNGSINDLIMASIRTAQVTIADVTLQRQGVYFEAGFALGLGRTVVWCCRKDDMPNVHFDTRHYSHLVWTSPEDLREKLEARLRATVALPVSAPTSQV